MKTTKKTTKTKAGLRFEHFFVPEGQTAPSQVEWGLRDAKIEGREGVVFEQKGVEFPTDWSETAAAVVASKYFRGQMTSPERETSVKQMVARVVNTIKQWGLEGDYFATQADADRWAEELSYLIFKQYASFNSPVWFNIGVKGRKQQPSACFINSIEDNMDSIMDLAKTEAMIFKGGSGAGVNLSKLRGSKEQLSGGGYASGPVSFMRGYDSFAAVIKSGGTTRRAAKMVILNADHPDVEEFIRCKQIEEHKAWALIEAGYDAGFNVAGGAYDSVMFQNANHSVRVTDEFMRAVERDDKWQTHAVADGQVIETVPARKLWDEIADAAWDCGDPGLQFDDVIQDWNCVPNTARINATNPCSEFVFVDDSACNLLSFNLMKFWSQKKGFDVEAYKRAIDVCLTAMEILVGPADYPTPAITENSRRLRPLGIGYSSLGALLMANGLAYDSEAGREVASAVTAMLTGRAYAQSARMAAVKGVFEDYAKNAQAMLRVIDKHQAVAHELKAANRFEALTQAAKESWDEAAALGREFGYRNAQVSLLAPVGTIGLMMDCDTTGVEPDLALVKYKRLVGGGSLHIVNQGVEAALRGLGYDDSEVPAIIAYIHEHDTIEGAPYLKEEHLSVFDCAFKPLNGTRSIAPMGHVRMLAAVQPFLSGSASKCVIAETLLTTTSGLVRIGDLYAGQPADSFSAFKLGLVSTDGLRTTDAFYYGGKREVLKVKLKSGHQVTGTLNHRLLVSGADGHLDWRRLDALRAGDYVATQYGADVWAAKPASLSGFQPSKPHGTQKHVHIPVTMSDDLAFFLGAYAAEGDTARSTWTIRIANTDEGVIARLVALAKSLFDISARVERGPKRCPVVLLSSKTLVEFFEFLGCGWRASNKRIPNAVLCSPRSMVIAFLNGLSLDSYLPLANIAWAITLDSPGLLDDLQAVLTNLDVVHSRHANYNPQYDKFYGVVQVSGPHARALAQMLTFPEAHKRDRAAAIMMSKSGEGKSDVIPGVNRRLLYDLIPKGHGGKGNLGVGASTKFHYLVDPRTMMISRDGLARVAAHPGVILPAHLAEILERNIHFSPIVKVEAAGIQEVFDVSVPVTNAFIGNGIVNHNTVNLPTSATREDIKDIYMQSWKLGLKCVALYRDGCKRSQPLSTKKEGAAEVKVVEKIVERPARKRLPDTRKAITHKFSISGHEGYITVGIYEDGSPGEVFIVMSKEGSTISGLMDGLATQTSLGLQYGVPLGVMAKKFTHTRFEPSGYTKNPEIPIAKSILDYLFRWLISQFGSTAEKEEAGLVVRDEDLAETDPDEVEEAAPVMAKVYERALPVAEVREHYEADVAAEGEMLAFRNDTDAPACSNCGSIMVRGGTCYRCLNCGESAGCS